MDPLLSPDAAATVLNVSTRTLAFWRHERKGPAYIKVGKRVRYRPSDLEAFLETRRRQPGTVEP